MYNMYMYMYVHLCIVCSYILCKTRINFVIIQLKGKVLVTEVTIEHIPKTLSPSGKLDSAPKDFSVYVSTRLHSVFESTFVSCN